jgi:hypothetical protein
MPFPPPIKETFHHLFTKKDQIPFIDLINVCSVNSMMREVWRVLANLVMWAIVCFVGQCPMFVLPVLVRPCLLTCDTSVGLMHAPISIA